MKIELIKSNLIKPNPINPRQIDEERFLKLIQSIKEFPEMANSRPIIINNKMEVLGGNMRLKAMLKLEWKEIPVIKVDWNEDKQKEFILKDNSNYGYWDFEILKTEFSDFDLKELCIDMPKENFEPNVSPEFNKAFITSDDIVSAEEKIKPSDKIAETIEVICPDCGCEFHIKN